MLFFKLPLPLTSNQMYQRTRSGRAYIHPSAQKYKKDCYFLLSNYRNSFKEKEELIYFLMWGLTSRHSDSHNREKLLWDAIEYAGVYPNDRYLRHSAGSTTILDRKKEGFVIVGLQEWGEFCKWPYSLFECIGRAEQLLKVDN